MPITVKLKHLRTSPRKVRLVADAIRGMDVDTAEIYLGRAVKRAAAPLKKLLRSAVSGAEHDFQKGRSSLFIKTITVDSGPMLKRFRARAFGRAADIHKHTSHVTLVLGERLHPVAKKRFVLQEERKTPKMGSGEGGSLEELGQAKTEAGEEESGKQGGTFRAHEVKKTHPGGIRKRMSDIGKKFFRRKSV